MIEEVYHSLTKGRKSSKSLIAPNRNRSRRPVEAKIGKPQQLSSTSSRHDIGKQSVELLLFPRAQQVLAQHHKPATKIAVSNQ